MCVLVSLESFSFVGSENWILRCVFARISLVWSMEHQLFSSRAPEACSKVIRFPPCSRYWWTDGLVNLSSNEHAYGWECKLLLLKGFEVRDRGFQFYHFQFVHHKPFFLGVIGSGGGVRISLKSQNAFEVREAISWNTKTMGSCVFSGVRVVWRNTCGNQCWNLRNHQGWGLVWSNVHCLTFYFLTRLYVIFLLL